MKHIYRIFILFLALALFTAGAAAAEGTFTFRNGVTWDTTPEQMLAAEGLAKDGYNRQEVGGYTFFHLERQGVYYVYRNVSGAELLVQAYSELPGDAYAAELDMHTAQFGAPIAIAADMIAALINMIQGPGTVAPEEVSNIAAWQLSDGTLAALFMYGGKRYMAYFNEQRILGGV